MLVYRISKREYINDLSGIGAGLYGGRWNPKGMNLVYTAANIALAYVEFLVHNYHLLTHTNVCMACIEVSDKAGMVTYGPEKLPDDWNRQNNNFTRTQELGRKFIADHTGYILKVPSVVVPGEFNLLLNPQHNDHRSTKIIEVTDPFAYDKRLLKHLKGKQ